MRSRRRCCARFLARARCCSGWRLLDTRWCWPLRPLEAPEHELALLRKVLDCGDLVAEVTSAADVDTAKPKPDLIHVALQRAGVSADQAVFVGDAIWDAEACARAHVTSLGVLSGGVSRGELENAGAVMVFENVDDLVKHIEETPIARLAGIGS